MARSEVGKRHVILQTIMFFFVLLQIMLIAKVAFDDKNDCSWNVVNSTVSGSTTSYEYEYQCNENSNSTSSTYYRLVLWFIILTFVYFFCYYIYIGFRAVIDWLKRMGRGP